MDKIIKKTFINFDDLKIRESIKVFIAEEFNKYLKLNENVEKDVKKISNNINIIDKIFEIIHFVTSKPLVNYDEISSNINIKDKKILHLLFKIIRNINSFQDIIIKKGLGTKYYKNLIIPLIKSKSIENFLNKKYSFPFRVGLFPGLSCMFKCSFCGRN